MDGWQTLPDKQAVTLEVRFTRNNDTGEYVGKIEKVRETQVTETMPRVGGGATSFDTPGIPFYWAGEYTVCEVPARFDDAIQDARAQALSDLLERYPGAKARWKDLLTALPLLYR